MSADGDPAERVAELTRAVIDLRGLCLHRASLWASEQLCGLRACEGARKVRERVAREAGEGAEVDPRYLLAVQYFEGKEYRRSAHFLQDVPGTKALFLKCYSMYLSGEKRKEEERIEKSGLLGRGQMQNTELEKIERELEAVFVMGAKDPFLLYMYGLALSDRDRKTEARRALVESVKLYPCNWGAWQALQNLCPDIEIVNELDLPRHWVREFFLANLCLDLQHNQEGLSRLQSISQQFPDSHFVVSHAAIAHYNLRNFEESQDLFEDLLKKDPHRLEGTDIYSNILYVKEMFSQLSFLAHNSVLTDKYRPETCCIVGNYYSLKGCHERALEYFQRALRLDRNYLSAWTLMGHEYVEISNCVAAIDAYRRAVDLNSKDFRAWYGLGQAYEMMNMPYYALYYFRRATQLRPHDARMWTAMGTCYSNELLNMPDAAIRCYRRAVANNDREGVAVNMLARLHQKCGQDDEAAHYFKINLDRLDAQRGQDQASTDAVDAMLFLANYHKLRGNFADAEEFCTRLLDVGGVVREKAKLLLREIRSRLAQQDCRRHTRGSSGATGAPGSVTDATPEW